MPVCIAATRRDKSGILRLTKYAIANAAKTFVDTNNAEVVPFTENGRTLVPVRFISENIGGNVSSLGGYYNELKYFVEGLQGKNDLSVATVSEAVKSVQLVKREIEAAGGLIVK